jgi:hypothetical protein
MKRVLSQPMRMSQCKAMSMPDPTAGPLIIAIVGLRISEMSRCRSVNPWKKCWRAASGPSWAPRLPGKFSPVMSGDARDPRFAPEQNPRPTPVNTITRMFGSSSPACMYSPTFATVPFSSDVPTSAFIRSGRLNLIQRTPLSSGS